MEQRINYSEAAPEAMKLMIEMEKYIASTEIDGKLRELMKVRASQMNGCAFCLNMHTAEARKKRRNGTAFILRRRVAGM
jgi:AhpD family alkylhydroperoxidase